MQPNGAPHPRDHVDEASTPASTSGGPPRAGTNTDAEEDADLEAGLARGAHEAVRNAIHDLEKESLEVSVPAARKLAWFSKTNDKYDAVIWSTGACSSLCDVIRHTKETALLRLCLTALFNTTTSHARNQDVVITTNTHVRLVELLATHDDEVCETSCNIIANLSRDAKKMQSTFRGLGALSLLCPLLRTANTRLSAAVLAALYNLCANNQASIEALVRCHCAPHIAHVAASALEVITDRTKTQQTFSQATDRGPLTNEQAQYLAVLERVARVVRILSADQRAANSLRLLHVPAMMILSAQHTAPRHRTLVPRESAIVVAALHAAVALIPPRDNGAVVQLDAAPLVDQTNVLSIRSKLSQIIGEVHDNEVRRLATRVLVHLDRNNRTSESFSNAMTLGLQPEPVRREKPSKWDLADGLDILTARTREHDTSIEKLAAENQILQRQLGELRNTVSALVDTVAGQRSTIEHLRAQTALSRQVAHASLQNSARRRRSTTSNRSPSPRLFVSQPSLDEFEKQIVGDSGYDRRRP